MHQRSLSLLKLGPRMCWGISSIWVALFRVLFQKDLWLVGRALLPCCVDDDAILWLRPRSSVWVLPCCCRVLFGADLFHVLTLLWFRNLWVMTSFVKYITRVARISSSASLQHGVISFAHSSRFSRAIAAILFVAFVMLAAFVGVHTATMCGLPDPVGGSGFEPVGAATLVALLAASFVFVLLLSFVQELAGVLNYIGAFVGIFWCQDGDIAIFCSRGFCSLSAASISSSFCV